MKNSLLNSNKRRHGTEQSDFESYFKIGISDDFILLRDDFPIASIPPSDFSRLCLEMFRQNEKVLRDGK